MIVSNSIIRFNNIDYTILNSIIHNDLKYYLIFNKENNNYKVVYEYEGELFQMINNKDYKEIMKLLCKDIDI